MIAHPASLMSDGYRGTRVLRPIPPGQHRHATPRLPGRVPWACAGSPGFLIVTNRDHGDPRSQTRVTTRRMTPRTGHNPPGHTRVSKQALRARPAARADCLRRADGI